MAFRAEYKGTTYDFAVSSTEATWWGILASLGLPSTGVPFDEAVLAVAGYELKVSVARYEDAMCGHMYACNFGCEDREVGPVWVYRVINRLGPIVCNECLAYSAVATCPDCPPARHESTCGSCAERQLVLPADDNYIAPS